MYERDKKTKTKKSPPTKQMSFEVVMLTPIVKIKILIKEIECITIRHEAIIK